MTVPNLCEVCKKQLPSRNKLFQHIKETGHAVLKQQAGRGIGNQQGQGSQRESRGSATNNANDRKKTKNKRK